MTHQITISWTASPGTISGYNVRRGTAPGNESPAPLNATPIVGTSYTDLSVFPGVSYSYEVTAVYNGVESAESLAIFTAPVPFGDNSPPSLDGYLVSSASFGVLAASTVTNIGATSVSGDVGVSPGTSITGMGAPASISGVLHNNDFVAAAAQTASAAAFAHGNLLPGATTMAADIGGSTLAPGLYNVASSLAITGSLVLDGGGNPNATWIFQIGSTLTTASTNSSVTLVGGAQANNVFWLVGSSATLNGGTVFAGQIIANASITVNAGVAVNGTLTALTGAVTLNNDSIVMFMSGTLGIYAAGTAFAQNEVIYDCASKSYQRALNSGVTGATEPLFSNVIGTTVVDGGVTWISLDPPLTITVSSMPPSPPNVPPAAPAAPTNLFMVSEN